MTHRASDRESDRPAAGVGKPIGAAGRRLIERGPVGRTIGRARTSAWINESHFRRLAGRKPVLASRRNYERLRPLEGRLSFATGKPGSLTADGQSPTVVRVHRPSSETRWWSGRIVRSRWVTGSPTRGKLGIAEKAHLLPAFFGWKPRGGVEKAAREPTLSSGEGNRAQPRSPPPDLWSSPGRVATCYRAASSAGWSLHREALELAAAHPATRGATIGHQD